MTYFRRPDLALLLGAALPAAMALPASAASAAQVQVPSQGPVISLSVTEEVRSSPDAASFGTGVTTTAPTASAALRQNSQQMQALIKRIKALGVEDKDIQTSGISLNAQYDYPRDGERQFTGYQVSNMVTVTVRKIDLLGDMLDKIVAGGADNLNGPRFFIADDMAVKAEARARTIRSAQAQALAYAKAAGYSDIRLLSISEAVFNGGGEPQQPRPMAARLKAEDASAPVQPGEVGTSVTVAFDYEMVR